MELYEQAEQSVNTRAKLLRRLRAAVSVMKTEYQKRFPRSCRVDYIHRRMLSTCGRFVLQWTNDGKTNQGTCYVVEVS